MNLLFNLTKIISTSIYIVLLIFYSIFHTILLCLKGTDFNPTNCNILIDILLILIPSILLFIIIVFSILINESYIKYSLYLLITSIALSVAVISLVFLKYMGYANIFTIFLPRYLKVLLLIVSLSSILLLFNFLIIKIKN